MGVKTALLRYFVGFTKEERRDAFSSRMNRPYDVSALTAKYSERRIRIADMIGRRGRFFTIACAGFYYLYVQIAQNPNTHFAICVTIVTANGLGLPWLVLSLILATSNCLLELYSPRGTDDFTMGTANALICWAFGVWLY